MKVIYEDKEYNFMLTENGYAFLYGGYDIALAQIKLENAGVAEIGRNFFIVNGYRVIDKEKNIIIWKTLKLEIKE